MHFVGQSYKAAEQFATFKSYLALKSLYFDTKGCKLQSLINARICIKEFIII